MFGNFEYLLKVKKSGHREDRTPDLRVISTTLYRLSYATDLDSLRTLSLDMQSRFTLHCLIESWSFLPISGIK